jgi:hypothetical protein
LPGPWAFFVSATSGLFLEDVELAKLADTTIAKLARTTYKTVASVR